MTDGVVDVIMYPSSTDKTKNRGFAFVEYKSHKAAAMARRKLLPGTYLLSIRSVCVWAVIVCLPDLFMNTLCSVHLCFLCFLLNICVSSGLVPHGCTTGTFQLWGQSIQVDWAEPEKDVEEEVMQRVRVLYVSPLMSEQMVTQDFLDTNTIFSEL